MWILSNEALATKVKAGVLEERQNNATLREQLLVKIGILQSENMQLQKKLEPTKIEDEAIINSIEVGYLIFFERKDGFKATAFGEVAKIYFDPARRQRFFLTTENNLFYASDIVYFSKPLTTKTKNIS
jgi:hypothetical protein